MASLNTPAAQKAPPAAAAAAAAPPAAVGRLLPPTMLQKSPPNSANRDENVVCTRSHSAALQAAAAIASFKATPPQKQQQQQQQQPSPPPSPPPPQQQQQQEKKSRMVGNVRLNVCACRREYCVETVRRWHAVALRDKRFECFVGYQTVAPLNTKYDNERTRLHRAYRAAVFDTLQTEDKSSDKTTYVANHHYHLALLYYDPDRRSSSKWTIDKLLTKDKFFLLQLSEEESQNVLYKNGQNPRQYAFCVPSYHWLEMQSHLAIQEAKIKTGMNSSDASSLLVARKCLASNYEKQIPYLKQRMFKWPEQCAIEYLHMQQRIETLVPWNASLRQTNEQLKQENEQIKQENEQLRQENEQLRQENDKFKQESRRKRGKASYKGASKRKAPRAK